MKTNSPSLGTRSRRRAPPRATSIASSASVPSTPTTSTSVSIVTLDLVRELVDQVLRHACRRVTVRARASSPTWRSSRSTSPPDRRSSSADQVNRLALNRIASLRAPPVVDPVAQESVDPGISSRRQSTPVARMMALGRHLGSVIEHDSVMAAPASDRPARSSRHAARRRARHRTDAPACKRARSAPRPKARPEIRDSSRCATTSPPGRRRRGRSTRNGVQPLRRAVDCRRQPRRSAADDHDVVSLVLRSRSQSRVLRRARGTRAPRGVFHPPARPPEEPSCPQSRSKDRHRARSS